MNELPLLNKDFVTYLLNKALKNWWDNPDRKSDKPFVSIKVYDFEVKEQVRDRIKKFYTEYDVVDKEKKRQSRTKKHVWKKVVRQKENNDLVVKTRSKPVYTMIDEIYETKSVEIEDHERMVVDVSYVGNRLFCDDHCKLPYGGCIRSTNDEFVEVIKKEDEGLLIKSKVNTSDPISLQFLININYDETEEQSDYDKDSDDSDCVSESDKWDTYSIPPDRTCTKIKTMNILKPLTNEEETKMINFWMDDTHLASPKHSTQSQVVVSSSVGIPITINGETLQNESLLDHRLGRKSDKEPITPFKLETKSGETQNNYDLDELFKIMKTTGQSSGARSKINLKLRAKGYTDVMIRTARSCLSNGLQMLSEVDYEIVTWYNKHLKNNSNENDEEKKVDKEVKTNQRKPDELETPNNKTETSSGIKNFGEMFRVMREIKNKKTANKKLAKLGFTSDEITTGRACLSNRLETNKGHNVESVIDWFVNLDLLNNENDVDIYSEDEEEDDYNEPTTVVIPVCHDLSGPSWHILEERPFEMDEETKKTVNEIERINNKKIEERRLLSEQIEKMKNIKVPDITYDFLDD